MFERKFPTGTSIIASMTWSKSGRAKAHPEVKEAGALSAQNGQLMLPPLDKKTSDDEIAKRAIDILGWDTMVPSDSIQVMVRDGCVTLTGSVEWYYQKNQAEEDIRKLSGVRGVINAIKIEPRVHAEDVKHKIEQALKRHAAIESDDAIRVTVPEPNKVILEGRVNSWEEYYAVVNAAWSAPGVKSVEDRIIGPFVYDDNDDD